MDQRMNRDTDHLMNSMHYATKALIAGDRSEYLRQIASVRFWANEIIDDGTVVPCALRVREELSELGEVAAC